MKTISLTLTLSIATLAAAQEPEQLFNLRNAYLLKSKDMINSIKPFESLALVKTFDEIPVFGGSEFRH
jgi:hypothetical protein